MKNWSGNDGVLEGQDRAVASIVNVAIDSGVSAHQKISVPSQTKIAVDKSVTKSPAEVIAVAQGKRGPALEVAYFGNNPRDIGFSMGGAEQNEARRDWQKRFWRNRKHTESHSLGEVAAGSAP